MKGQLKIFVVTSWKWTGCKHQNLNFGDGINRTSLAHRGISCMKAQCHKLIK